MPGDLQPAEEERADQQPGDQVGRDVRQMQALDQPGHHQPGEQRKRNG